MRQGTTPLFEFELPFGAANIKKAKITFRQNRTIILEKKEECIIADDKVSLSLTQDETFLFDPRFEASVQLRVVTAEGDALASDVHVIEVTECLDREVL